MSSPPSARAQEKRRRILAASLDLILQLGLQGTTMEAIARQARIAKPTLYTYFPDKFAVFETLIGELVDARASTFLAAFETGAEPKLQITSALTEMFGSMADMVAGSPHAGEILTESRQFAHRLAPASEKIIGRLASALGQIGFDHERELAAVLLASGSGILSKYRDGTAVRRAVSLLCTSLLNSKNA